MNDDGKKDLLITRANHSTKTGELVWFEYPAIEHPLQDIEWIEHKITEGPDLFSVIEEIGSNEILLWTSQFYTKSVAVYKISIASSTPG